MKALIYEEDYTKEPEAVEIPAEYKEKAEEYRQKMLDSVAETDDE